jgi:hypothetical protein
MKKLIQFLLLNGTAFMLTIAQTPVVETFNYEVGAIDGKGSAENGWGSSWSINGTSGNIVLTESSIDYSGLQVSGNKLEVTASDGTGTEAIRSLAETWTDSSNKVYWISFLFEITNPTGINESWQGLSLDLSGEQGYIGKLWGTSFLGINDPDPYLNVPSTREWSAGITWMVVKIKMSGDEGVDTTYLWLNPDPNTEPSNSSANVTANITLNSGFNAIRCHLGQTAGIIAKFDEIRMGTSWSHVTYPATGLNDEIMDNSRVKIYPNPFSSYTNINYRLKSSEKVILEIYSINGERVETLINDIQTPNEYNIQWNADKYSSGIYFYKLQIGNHSIMNKIVLLR